MRIKKLIGFLLCLVLLCSLASPAFAAQNQAIVVDPINVMVGGKVFLPTDANGKDVPIFVYNGTTYAPLRALAEAYGLTVGYNSEKKLATVDGTPSADFVGTNGTAQALTERTTISVSPINIEVNGAVFQPKDANGSDVSVFVYSGTTYAPLRALAEAYGLTVGYDTEKRLATVEFEVAERTEFAEISAEISAAHKALVTSTTSFADVGSFIVSDPSVADLLSAEDVQALTTESGLKDTLTYAEAAADVDIFFRAFQAAYGGYYYFGDAAFDEAKAEVMAWLSGRSSVSRNAFETVLADAMDFLQDAHVSIGGVDRGIDLEYEYYYCEGQNYYTDDAGCYKTANGEKWYFVSFSDSRVSLERSLTSEGEVVYSPVLFCPEPEMKNCTVTLKNASGSTRTENITWIRNDSYWGGYFSDVDYNLIEEDGVAYISLRSCDNYYSETLFEYAASGSELRDASLIIFDIRGNGGGSELYSMEWVTNFIGYSSSLPIAGGTRYSTLRTATGFDDGSVTAGTFESYSVSGRWIENDIPIIVLVDEYVASAGESTLNYLRSMDNVIVVGSNTAGAQLCGNVMGFTLPNSGTFFCFGSGLSFQYDTTNKDFRGYEPDIWCNPKDSLDAVMKMAERYEIAADMSGMDDAMDDIVTSKVDFILELRGSDNSPTAATLLPGERTGMPMIDGSQYWVVVRNGEDIKDYTVWSNNPDICKITTWPDFYGFEARTMGHGTCKFYVTVDGETAEFIWYAG